MGAHSVQIDFTEARLAIKIDPTGALLASFIDLNNLALGRLTPAERLRVGVHTCPGGDRDSTHSADVPYTALLPSLFQLNVSNFYLSLAGERDREGALEIIAANLKPGHRAFVGVIAPIDPRLESAEIVRDRVLEAARFIPLHQLGTTDDCGFAPFCDDTVDIARTGVREDPRARGRHGARGSESLGRAPVTTDDEEQRIRAAALKNVEAILSARQRAERELVAAKADARETHRGAAAAARMVRGDAGEHRRRGHHHRYRRARDLPESHRRNPHRLALERSAGKPLPAVFRIVNEDTREPVENPIDKVLESGKIVGLANHTALISRDGIEVSIEDSAAPIRDPQGKVTGAVMVFHDVSRRRAAERALRASEERLSAVFSQAALGIAVANLDGRFQEANLKFCSILGYSLEELRQRTFLELTHPDDVATTRAPGSEAARGQDRQLRARKALPAQGRQRGLEQHDGDAAAQGKRRSGAVHRHHPGHHRSQAVRRAAEPPGGGGRILGRRHHHEDAERRHLHVESGRASDSSATPRTRRSANRSPC